MKQWWKKLKTLPKGPSKNQVAEWMKPKPLAKLTPIQSLLKVLLTSGILATTIVAAGVYVIQMRDPKLDEPLTTQPKVNVEQTYTQAVQALKAKNYSQAETKLMKVIGAKGAEPVYLITLGLVFVYQGKLDQAKNLYRQSVFLDPDNHVAWNNAAHLLLREGEFAEAERTLRKALMFKGTYLHARLNLGLALERQGRVAEAIAEYENVLQGQYSLEEHRKDIEQRVQLLKAYRAVQKRGQG